MRTPHGSKIKEIRESQGLTQVELAQKARRASRTIERMEHSIAVSPSSIRAVAEALGIAPQEIVLLRGDGIEAPKDAEVADDDLIKLGVDVCEAVSAELNAAGAHALEKIADGEFPGKTVRVIDHLCNDAAYRVLGRWNKTALRVMGEDIEGVTQPSEQILCCLDSLDGTEHWAHGRKLYCTVISFFARLQERYRLRVSVLMDADGEIYYAREDFKRSFYAESREAFLARDPLPLTFDCRKQKSDLVNDIKNAHVCTVARRPDHFRVLAPFLDRVPCNGLYCYGGNLELARLAASGFDAVFQLNVTARDSQPIWDWLAGGHIALRSGCVVMGLDGKKTMLDLISIAESHLNLGSSGSPGYIVATNRALAGQIASWLERD